MNWTAPVDFLGTFPHYVEHLAPVYLALDEDMRGEFYVPGHLVGHALAQGIEAQGLKTPVNRPNSVKLPRSKSPIVTCAYRDLQIACRSGKRPQIFMQHGIGLTFPNNPAYAGGTGYQRYVDLFLHPNEYVARLVGEVFPDKASVVVGAPKMDTVKRRRVKKNKIICISFHWDGSAIAPEAGNAFAHYKSIIPVLAKNDDFTLIGHGHPRIMEKLEPFYRKHGIEAVCDFKEVMRRADIYVNDCSSTLYEFCTTGKPVIILNAPQFRRGLHFGIRFWDYADIGPQVDRAADLPGVIEQVLAGEDAGHKVARQKAVRELYPYRGESAERAANVMIDFLEKKGPPVREITEVSGESIGIVYMSFGKPAARAIRASINSLRRLGISIPACVVGDTPVRGCQFVEWTGKSPFDPKQPENFQFRAGRVKPYLYQHTPYERTLYIDADTEFISDIMKGFQTLDENDMAIAHELLKIGELYNKPRAGWEINIKERNATIKEIGGNPEIQFLNSGVIFFRKSTATEKVMAEWGRQWLRWQQWDEQLSLMRAIYAAPELKLMVLSTHWNHPHRELAKVIFHNYGRGVCRSNVN